MSISICDLPAELLTDIFEQVVYDDSLVDSSHPTSMSLSRWDRRPSKRDWVLVSPYEDVHSKQTTTYTTTKAIMFTCKQWYRIAYHLLFRCIFLSDISRLAPLCFVLDRYTWLGWYVKRLHLVRYYSPRRFTISHVENMLVTVIQHCPNLELFTVEWTITPSFPAIADSLVCFSAKSLRSVQWKIGPDCLAGLIWALDALPSLYPYPLISKSIDVSDPTFEDTSPLLGTASHISLTLSCLQQLTVRGLSQEFIEQATGWTFPVLQSFTLDFAAHRDNLPDITEFLKHHGAQLTFLDLNTIPALDLPGILAACPMLTSFSFNPDWRLSFHAESNDDGLATLMREPHSRITHLGLHQLLHAFLPPSQGTNGAPGSSLPQVATMLLQRTNDLTFSQLTRKMFPALKVVRLLNRTLLAGLERQDGPEDEGYARWERWEAQCETEGVRLEDCTGALLGDLPLDSEDEWEEDSEHEYEMKEQESGLRPSNVKELRDLLDEIRRMSVAEPTPFLSEEGFAAIL
ncbi:hypothetical protein B0F90DRAFT_1625294 [Multifurca ochricompacta]|uniref:Uncharacterized protein n=1 Tax=Multifurca ochricompacta TaxID=376703 RepID=A0AAD4QQH5_9AGAM|nr:hypothetical protein B0F90DRAFT_1625294 [Multifurca ochricompacta]